MKKTYLKPETTKVTVVYEQNLLQSSLEVKGTTNNEEDLLSRGANPTFNIWDDDEEK